MTQGDPGGRLIAFEGPDGVGKTTQVKFLVEYLRAKGVAVTQTREPGGTRFGEELREVLLNTRDLDPKTVLFAVQSARIHHVREVIRPALLRGEWVVTDRYVGSSFAYQGFAGNLGTTLVQQSIDLIGDLPLADLTFYLDAERPMGGFAFDDRDLFERQGFQFWSTVRDGFRACAELFQWTVISAERPSLVVSDEIKSWVSPLMDTGSTMSEP